MDGGQVRVGLKYCGGCQARHDRIAALRSIQQQCLPETAFEPVKDGVEYDYILIINGCQAQCADCSQLRSKNGLFSVFQWSDNTIAVDEIKRLEKKDPAYDT